MDTYLKPGFQMIYGEMGWSWLFLAAYLTLIFQSKSDLNQCPSIYKNWRNGLIQTALTHFSGTRLVTNFDTYQIFWPWYVTISMISVALYCSRTTRLPLLLSSWQKRIYVLSSSFSMCIWPLLRLLSRSWFFILCVIYLIKTKCQNSQ